MNGRFSLIPSITALVCLVTLALAQPLFSKNTRFHSGTKSTHPLGYKAELAMKKGDYEKAISIYRQVVDSPDAGNLDARTRIAMLENLSLCYISSLQNRAAYRRCEQALGLLSKSEINDPYRLYSLKALLADILRRQRRFERSQAVWAEVITFANSRQNAFVNAEYDKWRYGFLYLLLDMKKCREARQLATNLLERSEKRHGRNHPKTVPLLVALRIACTDCEDCEQAIAYQKRIMAIQSAKKKQTLRHQIESLNMLGWLYSLAEDHEEAIVLFRKSRQLVALLPKSDIKNIQDGLAADLLLAGCLFKTGRIEEAERYYRMADAACDAHPELPVGSFIDSKKYYIDFLHRQGRDREAEVLEQKVLKLLDDE